jgi:hypothetical protein
MLWRFGRVLLGAACAPLGASLLLFSLFEVFPSLLEAVRKLMSNKSIAYKSLKVWQEIDCPVSLFLALPRI